MKNYAGVRVCPETKEQIFDNEYAHGNGVCPRCGHSNDHSTFTHKDILVGEWKYPPLFDRIFRGVKPQFIRKSE